MIVVNGRRMEASVFEPTYEDVLLLAGLSSSSTVVTVTFRCPRCATSGSLAPGQKVEAHPGMIFNAVHTGAA